MTRLDAACDPVTAEHPLLAAFERVLGHQRYPLLPRASGDHPRSRPPPSRLRIYLVPGNHDRSQSKLDAFRWPGWKLIRPVTWARKGSGLEFTHEPIVPENLPPNTLNIHGHIHHHVVSPWHLNCSVGHIGFAPTRLAPLIDDALAAAHSGSALQHEGAVVTWRGPPSLLPIAATRDE